jgi:hypothetical protein
MALALSVLDDLMPFLHLQKKVEALNNQDPFGRQKSPQQSPSQSPSRQRLHRKYDDDDDDDNNDNLQPILRLDDEDSAITGPSRSQRSTQGSSITPSHKSHSSSKGGGFQLGQQTNNELPKTRGRSRQKKEEPAKVRDDDPKLPMFPFSAGEEFGNKENAGSSPKKRTPGDDEEKHGGTGGPTKFDPRKYVKQREEIRTDVNEKAKFLAPPTGKFRREFSNDHPLANHGTGKYKKELSKGLTPTGLDLPAPKNELSQTLELANKVEKLTFEATTSVIDSEKSIDQIEKELKAQLHEIIDEERLAEEDRSETISRLRDESEKARLEHIFAEERQRASERIMKATKDHDDVLKKAMLAAVNLGNS